MSTQAVDLSKLEQQVAEFETKLSDITKAKETAEAIVALTIPQRMVYDELSKEDQAKYLAGDEDVRKSLTPVEKAGDEEEEEEEISPAIAKRFEDVSKQLKDAQTKLAAAELVAKNERDARETIECSKRADTEFANLPGTAAEKGLVLKTLKTKLTSEEVAEVEKLLKAGNEALSQLATPVGKSGTTKDDISKSSKDAAWAKIEKKVEVLATAEKLPFAKALDKVLTTDKEAQLLYEQYNNN